MAETKKDAVTALEAFVETYQVKYERAADCLTKDRDALLAFYDFPAEHWKHLRTTDEIDKAFSAGSLAHVGTSRALALFASPFCPSKARWPRGCWDAALSTPTAAGGGGRRPAFTKPHPSSDNRPWPRGAALFKAKSLDRALPASVRNAACCGIVVLHGARQKSRARGCKPDRAAFSVAPRLRHPCAAWRRHAAAIGARTAHRLVQHGARARSRDCAAL
jgi:hypothetical protein